MNDNPNSANDYAVMSGVIGNGCGGTASGLVKNGPGLLVLTATNTYGDGAGYDNGATQINQGALQADWGVGYSSNSGLILNGGVLQSNSAVTFSNRFWYDGWNDSVTWYSGGFSAGGGKMTVNLYGDGRAINWGTDARGGIVGTMILSSTSAQYETEVKNALNLNGAVRTIQVDDNPNSSGDFATISGVIADGSAAAARENRRRHIVLDRRQHLYRRNDRQRRNARVPRSKQRGLPRQFHGQQRHGGVQHQCR